MLLQHYLQVVGGWEGEERRRGKVLKIAIEERKYEERGKSDIKRKPKGTQNTLQILRTKPAAKAAGAQPSRCNFTDTIGKTYQFSQITITFGPMI